MLERKDLDSQESKELTGSTNRIVVYGSGKHGTPDFVDALTSYLESVGVSNSEVEWTPDVALLNQTFFGGGKNEAPAGFVPPRGVIVFSQMRQFTPPYGTPMTVDAFEAIDLYGKTFIENVRELCDRYGVPCIALERFPRAGESQEEMRALLPRF